MVESTHTCNTCQEAFELSEFLEVHLKGTVVKNFQKSMVKILNIFIKLKENKIRPSSCRRLVLKSFEEI